MDANIAVPASLIGDPSRAAMLMALMDDRAMPATALAWAAGVSAQSASNHLAQLVGGGLLKVAAQGRHRYYRLASPDVARALETLAVLGPLTGAPAHPRDAKARAMREARSCYDHLAGRLGVALADALEFGGLIERDGAERYRLTATGRERLDALGVDLSPIRPASRAAMRPCPDWTERRRHLAGPLAARLMTRLIDLDWLRRTGPTRALLLTPVGHRGLIEALGLDLGEASAAA
jgi:DNA-binding transcriptional ArsR family regulator